MDEKVPLPPCELQEMGHVNGVRSAKLRERKRRNAGREPGWRARQRNANRQQMVNDRRGYDHPGG
jgi:hypothetical protein